MASMPRKCPGDGLGASPGTPGTSRPDLCVIPHSGVNKSARERIGRQNLSQKGPLQKGVFGSHILQGIIGKTHTQDLQILREDTLGATCSAGPFCLLPTHRLDRMSPGQTGHFHRTNGTRPRDGCGPEVGVSRQISLCLLDLSLPNFFQNTKKSNASRKPRKPHEIKIVQATLFSNDPLSALHS